MAISKWLVGSSSNEIGFAAKAFASATPPPAPDGSLSKASAGRANDDNRLYLQLGLPAAKSVDAHAFAPAFQSPRRSLPYH